MKITEQVINEATTRINKRLAVINNIIDANPLRDIIQLREAASEKLEGRNYMDSDIRDYISNCAKKEKALFAIAEQRKKLPELLDEKCELESELADLKILSYRLGIKQIEK